ncbi:GspE/PulE family protein [Nocardioides dubius]|uniref:GspE/PulE family protein n=1 Tax=Nocardioides dubius TaxID=317019 RepID=A0ABP4EGV4_9ACTN
MRIPLARHRSEQAPVEAVPVHADETLARVLITAGRLQPYQLDAAEATPGDESLAEKLVSTGTISADALARTLAEHYRAELVDFRTVTPEPDAVTLLTLEQARQLLALPLAVVDDVVTVATVDPAPERVEAISACLSRTEPIRIEIQVATKRDLDRAIDSAYRATHEVGSQVREFEARDQLRREAAQLETTNVNEGAPVVRVVQMILTQALRDRASDVHIEPSGERVRVRYRIDGALTDVLDLPGSIGPALVSRVKILAQMNIVERRRPQDGQISMSVEDREVDIRVATTAVVGGEKVVMRLLDKSRPLFQLRQLGMPADTAEQYRRLIGSPYGMVVCAGPTGGGKTTTLYASLGELNQPDKNIMTIEDPVEYTFDSINQIQINEQAGITFATGLKSILRQDPDIILVGEIRDRDTARIAVQSALTGHLVLSSLHATEAVAAVYRMLDMGIEGFLIASSVTAVVAQRLVRRSCTSCLAPYQPTPEELGFLRAFGATEPEGGFRRGTGCHFCAHTGFLERIGVYELLVVTDQIRELIVDRAPHDEMRKLARSQGMRTLWEQGARLVQDGTSTAAEVMRSIYVTGV